VRTTALILAFLCLLSRTAEAAGPNGNVQAQVGQIRSLIQENRIGEALRNLRALREQHPNDADVNLQIGEIFQELAALRAEQLQKAAPDSAAAHELSGKSWEAQGKLSEALAEYKLAAGKNPALPGVHFLIGNVEWKERNLSEAQGELAQELKLNPNHALANLRMGQISIDADRDHPERAVAYLRRAVANDRSLLEAHRELGKALRLNKQLPEAAQELQWVETKRPNDETVHAQLAAVYRDMGDRERARTEMEIHGRLLKERLEASQKMRTQLAQ
jgi:tetratricopeptide (TPR) repeat protein